MRRSAAPTPSSPPVSSPAPRRTLLGVIVALLVLAGAASLWSSGLVWRVEQDERFWPLPTAVYSVTGGSAVPMIVALGFVALAAIVAVLATGPIGRRLIGVAVLAVAVWTGVEIFAWAALDGAALAEAMIADGVKHGVDSAPTPSVVALPAAFAGFSAAFVAGALLIALPGRLPSMGSKYERPDAAPRSVARDDGAGRERDMWNSLDRGEDPTDEA